MMRSMLCGALIVCSVLKHEVARLGGRDREARRLQVAHFADHDDVRVLPQGVPEARGEIRAVGADFPLLDHAPLVLEQVLDRVLQRDDALAVPGVDQADHGGQRRAFARAGVARHEHQPARQVRQLLDDRRQVQIVDLEHLLGNHAERDGDRVPLEMGVDAEPVSPVDGRGEIQVPRFLEFLAFSPARPSPAPWPWHPGS